jgi:methylsterol monooxygenase
MDFLYNSLVYYTIFNATYYISSALIGLYDYKYNYDESNDTNYLSKIQSTDLNEIVTSYKKIIPTVMLNTFVYSLPIILIAGYYDTHIMTLPFNFTKCFFDLCIALLCLDPFFYFSHKLFHHKLLYNTFHKKHHEITKPVGMAALYSTCFEFYFGNIIPIFIPLYFVTAHPITIKIWTIIVIVNTILFSHSGYKNMADFHDKHHQYFNKNFGTDMYVDKLMGTYL